MNHVPPFPVHVAQWFMYCYSVRKWLCIRLRGSGDISLVSNRACDSGANKSVTQSNHFAGVFVTQSGCVPWFVLGSMGAGGESVKAKGHPKRERDGDNSVS